MLPYLLLGHEALARWPGSSFCNYICSLSWPNLWILFISALRNENAAMGMAARCSSWLALGWHGQRDQTMAASFMSPWIHLSFIHGWTFFCSHGVSFFFFFLLSWCILYLLKYGAPKRMSSLHKEYKIKPVMIHSPMHCTSLNKSHFEFVLYCKWSLWK